MQARFLPPAAAIPEQVSVKQKRKRKRKKETEPPGLGFSEHTVGGLYVEGGDQRGVGEGGFEVVGVHDQVAHEGEVVGPKSENQAVGAQFRVSLETVVEGDGWRW